MPTPLSYRKQIPLFHDKTATEYRQDIYERYDSMVIRQSALHLADELWQGYPMQAVLDYAKAYYPTRATNILEIGCSVGRWIATLAQAYPKATCWGLDYSYQMLRRANEYWVQGKRISIDLSHRGFPIIETQTESVTNLQFGLAKAEQLPHADNSQDLILSSFLLDRLSHPIEGLQEMYRVLRKGGRLIMVTPLNFEKAVHWETLYPTARLKAKLLDMGFQILDWNEKMVIHEPLDIRGNKLIWNCVGFVLST